uniref:Uncharacterized protein n=1 Tax=Solanum lycopersicum TaxID=4081 RepID=A0A3Q7H8X9_SOLLC
MKRQWMILNIRILVNPFDDLEIDAFRIVKNMTIVGIWHSIPSNFSEISSILRNEIGQWLLKCRRPFFLVIRNDEVFNAKIVEDI